MGLAHFSGEYFNLMQGKAVTIDKPNKDSLEAKAISSTNSDIVYINPKQLKTFGKISAYLTSYEKPKTINWHNLVDGVLIHKHETAVDRVK